MVFMPPNKSSSTAKPPKEDNIDEPIKGLGPHKKGPAHRDCTPCKFLPPIVSSLLYSLSF
jgi:hypothetical protein